MIRDVCEKDIPRTVEMGLRFHNQSTYRHHIAANAEQMKTLAETLMNKGIFLVDERDGQLVGMIGAFKFPHFISGEPIVGEVAWWVEPEYRGRGIALMRELEKRARQAGAKQVQMIAPTPEVAEIYKRMGYSFIESGYGKAL